MLFPASTWALQVCTTRTVRATTKTFVTWTYCVWQMVCDEYLCLQIECITPLQNKNICYVHFAVLQKRSLWIFCWVMYVCDCSKKRKARSIPQTIAKNKTKCNEVVGCAFSIDSWYVVNKLKLVTCNFSVSQKRFCYMHGNRYNLALPYVRSFSLSRHLHGLESPTW